MARWSGSAVPPTLIVVQNFTERLREVEQD
jgi:hypothetical protein